LTGAATACDLTKSSGEKRGKNPDADHNHLERARKVIRVENRMAGFKRVSLSVLPRDIICWGARF